MSTIDNFFRGIINFFSSIPTWITNLLDILIFAFIIYHIVILVRNTRIQQLAMGIVLFLLVYAVAAALNFNVLRFFMDAVLQFGLVVFAIIFQPELRRMLEQLGRVNSSFSKFFRESKMNEGMRLQWEKVIAAICDAAEIFAAKHTGAIIVIERMSNLDEVIRTGTPIRSEVNVELLDTIFYEGSALHDGAVVIRDARLEAAGCFLPLSNNLDISKDVGTRHRAALGMSENSDAVVIVISEETGIISLTKSAVLIRRLDRQNLFNLLVSEIIQPEPEEKNEGFFKRLLQGGQNGKENRKNAR